MLQEKKANRYRPASLESKWFACFLSAIWKKIKASLGEDNNYLVSSYFLYIVYSIQ